MTKKLARNLLYIFLVINIIGLIYFSYIDHNFIDIQHIQDYLQGPNLYIALSAYVLILTLRGLTLFPGTPLLIAGTFIFPKLCVIISVEIAILFYTLIIYKYSKILDFKIPEKLKNFKPKNQKYEILYILSLCLIPGMSMNGLAYFLSVQNIGLKKILIGMGVGTIITTTIYIYAFDFAISTTL